MKRIIFSILILGSVLSQTNAQASPELTGVVQTLAGLAATIQGCRMANKPASIAYKAAIELYRSAHNEVARPKGFISEALFRIGQDTGINKVVDNHLMETFQTASWNATPGVALGIFGVLLMAHGIHNLKKTEKTA